GEQTLNTTAVIPNRFKTLRIKNTSLTDEIGESSPLPRPLAGAHTLATDFGSSSLASRAGNCASPRIRHNIDQRRLAALNDRKRSLERRRQILWIAYRPFAVDAESARYGCEVDVRVRDRRA